MERDRFINFYKCNYDGSLMGPQRHQAMSLCYPEAFTGCISSSLLSWLISEVTRLDVPGDNTIDVGSLQ